MEAESSRSLEASAQALEPIEHIVVVMLENRSFDHMLGYLALAEHELPSHGEGDFPSALDGIGPGLANEHGGRTYIPAPVDQAVFTDKELDPPHDPQSVAAQIAGGRMSGFVSAFAEALARKERPDAARDPEVVRAVMSHTTPGEVPVYDHLARRFCVCDRWFCSLPGPTMPNRFYSVAGTTNGVVDNTALIIGQFGKFASVFRHLDPTAWRWYSSDPGILRAIDERYMFDTEHDYFAYFDQYTEVQPRSFLRDLLGDDEHEPDLPSVAWIDPNFAMSEMIQDLPITIDGPGSNDDHPPAPLINGQKLVNTIYQALGASEFWETSLLVVVYDEHGGFFDHVPPPEGRGPRIPALLVSPHVKRGVCGTTFHHASIIKTILLRFGAEGSIDRMPESVRDAADLSAALRSDGALLDFAPVTNAGAATVGRDDLRAVFLPENGSTLDRAVAYSDAQLTDLQRDVVQGIAIPLRTGYKLLRLARRRRLVRWLVPLLRRLRAPGKKRLEPRRP